MEKELEIIQLDNGLEYIVLDEIHYKTNKYLFLANYSNPEDIMIRKMLINDDSSLLAVDDLEFDVVFATFIERNNTK